MFNTGSQHGESIGAYGGEPLYHASLSAAEYETIIARFGFHVLQYAINDVDGRADGVALSTGQCPPRYTAA
jgi:hypothetical protein